MHPDNSVTFSKQDMLNSKSCNKNTAAQTSGCKQAKRLQETGSQMKNFNWNSKTEFNPLLGIQLTSTSLTFNLFHSIKSMFYSSNFINFQSVVQFHRFANGTTNIP